jgi:hypothetical protein
VKLEFGAVAKRLESENVQLFQFEQRILLRVTFLRCHPERNISVRWRIGMRSRKPALSERSESNGNLGVSFVFTNQVPPRFDAIKMIPRLDTADTN